MLAGIILRFFLASDMYLHAWDERYHALVAKNMMEHPFQPTLFREALLPFDYTDWTNNHIWLHKQPFPLWMMALSMKLFGVNELALRLPSILFSTLGIGLTYKIGAHLFQQKIGYIAAFLFSIHGLIIELTAGRVTTDHIDVAFLFFITLGVYFAVLFAQKKQHHYTILCGISIGIAILCKWLPALIVIPIWFSLVLEKEGGLNKQVIGSFFLLISCTLLVALPWQIYIHTTFPLEAQWESTYNFLHLFEDIEGHGKKWWYHLDRMRILYGEIIYIPVLYFCYVTFTKRWDFKFIALFVWVVVPFAFFSFAATKMQAYTLFTAPALFIISGWFYHHLKTHCFEFRWKWLVRLMLILLIALPIRFSLERLKPFDQHDRTPEWAIELRKLNDILPSNAVIFHVNRNIEAMFYTDALVYNRLPTEQEIATLTAQGYSIYLRSNGKESPEWSVYLEHLPSVKLEND